MSLERLEMLVLTGNNLTKIPDTLYQLKSLKVLGLGGNPIEEKDKEKLRIWCDEKQINLLL